MKLLALDTATPNCGVSVVADGVVLAELQRAGGNTHAVHLMGMVASALQMAGMALKALDGIAVTHGPGSFTGLRIGISTAKGLATAVGKPVAGVSTLRALALASAGGCPDVMAMIDARRGEVYHGRFRWDPSGLTRLSEDAAGPVSEAVSRVSAPCIFIGSGAVQYREIIEGLLGANALFPPWICHAPRAAAVALAAWERFEKGQGRDPAGLLPKYIRASDAKKMAAPVMRNP